MGKLQRWAVYLPACSPCLVHVEPLDIDRPRLEMHLYSNISKGITNIHYWPKNAHTSGFFFFFQAVVYSVRLSCGHVRTKDASRWNHLPNVPAVHTVKKRSAVCSNRRLTPYNYCVGSACMEGVLFLLAQKMRMYITRSNVKCTNIKRGYPLCRAP